MAVTAFQSIVLDHIPRGRRFSLSDIVFAVHRACRAQPSATLNALDRLVEMGLLEKKSPKTKNGEITYRQW